MAMKAELSIHTELRNGKTILNEVFYTPPFKIANISEDKNEKQLRLMMMSSSPGILDGDEYCIKIRVGEGSILQLETQSYQRLFQMEDGASQTIELHMAENSSFYFLPHPSVPHKGSHFAARNKLYLSKGCTLCWGEVMTSGRKLNGESFVFSKLHSLTEIYMDKKLVVKENLLMMPGITDLTGIGQLEGFSHQGSLLFINESAAVSDLIQQSASFLKRQLRIEFGCTALPVNGLLVRILGNKGEQLYNCLRKLSSFLEKTYIKNVIHAE